MGRLFKKDSTPIRVFRHRPHLGAEKPEKEQTGHHGRTPQSVLDAPVSTPVLLTYESAGYRAAPDGSLRRTTRRRGKKVRRARDV